MPTVDDQFFTSTSADDQTFSGEATIRKLVETAVADNTATTQTWTSTTAENRTVIPAAGSTVNSDTTQNNGWALNNGGADGVGATSTAKRVIHAGVWNFSIEVAVNAPALLASIPATLVTAKVYRVATGGGTRTLLFSTAFATFTASGIYTAASASQPAYELQSGEVIMVGYLINSAATAALVLGAVTNTVWTWTIGSDHHFTIPSPGMRTRYLTSYTGTAGSSGALQRVPTRVLSSAITPVSSVIKSLTRRLEGAVTPTSSVARRPSVFFSGSLPSLGSLLLRPTRVLSSSITPGPSTVGRTPTKLLSSNVTPTSTVSRFLSRSLTGTAGLAGSALKTPVKQMGSTITPGPSTVVLRPTKLLSSTITPSATVGSLLTKNFRGDLLPVGSLIKVLSRRLEAAIAPAGALRKTPKKFLTGLISGEGGAPSVIRRIRRLIVDD